MRYAAIGIVAILWAVSTYLVLGTEVSSVAQWTFAVTTPVLVLGVWNLVQREHSLGRNYPLIWYIRQFLESFRVQIRQYFIESDTDGAPFDRAQRSLAYRRAKDVVDVMPFGTERNVKEVGFEWINHSIQPVERLSAHPRVVIGNEQCRQPYDSSLLNISAMSFGALSAAAIRALNKGARIGGFAHDTGEGGLSPYHTESGGDLIWEIGTGYFGCRDSHGNFDSAVFADKSCESSVKMIQVKLSQGAKPGHGGVLPARKVSREIAEIRGVKAGIDCISPVRHRAFDSPIGLMEFVAQLRELSRGKPIGFKLCVGHRRQFISLCKAMIESEIYPDFIVVDGKEGGTGAAPVEFSDHVGTPRREGMFIAENSLRGCGIRDKVKLAASGKIISGFDMAVTMAIGADWCNSARGFMFALGCLQSQKCHTNRCPVGVATQSISRQRGLVVSDKSTRVANFHRNTVDALLDLIAAAGLRDPAELVPDFIMRRTGPVTSASLADAYDWLEERQLVDGGAQGLWRADWENADASTF